MRWLVKLERIWKTHVPRSNTTALKLKSSIPIDENLKWAYIQATILVNSIPKNPSVINQLDFRWVKDLSSPCLVSSTISPAVKLIHGDLLKTIQFSCFSQPPCKSQPRTYTKSGLSRLIFCKCKGGITCCNPWCPKSNNLRYEKQIRRTAVIT